MTGQAIPYAQPGQRPFAIEMRKVNKWFAMFHVLRNINLSVQVGERIVICGPSGSGKSTMIRCINHLENRSGRRDYRQRRHAHGRRSKDR